MVRLFALLMCVCLVSAAEAAEAVLTVPDTLIPGVRLEAQLTISNPSAWAATVLIPPVEGLSVIDGGSPRHQTSIINGEKSTKETRNLIIEASAVGTYTIPPIAVHLMDGSKLMTEPVTITVSSGNTNLVGEAVFTATFEPAQAVVGQPVWLVYRLAFSKNTYQIKQIDLAPPPNVEVLEDEELSETAQFAADGTQWRVLKKRWKLASNEPRTIQVSGQQTYYPCKLERSVFDSRWVITGAVQRGAIKPATLTIADVPTVGRPANWAGLLDAATLTATLDSQRITAGEGARLTIHLQGAQAARARPPTLPAIDGLRAYPRDPVESPTDREFSWDIIPSRPGTFVVPPISMSTFMPATNSFDTISTNPLSIEVLPGRTRDVTVRGNVQTVDRMSDNQPTTLRVLPPPLRHTQWTPSPLHTVLAFIALGLASWGVQFIRHRRPAPQLERPRGSKLRAACTATDWTEAAQLISRYQAFVAGNDAVALQRISQAIDLARFGNQPLTLSPEDAAVLERLP